MSEWKTAGSEKRKRLHFAVKVSPRQQTVFAQLFSICFPYDLPDKKTECYMSLFVRTKCSNCQLYYPFMVMKPHFCVVNRDLCDISQALCAFSWSLSDRGPVPLIQCNPALRPPRFIRSLRYTATTFRPRETATHFLIKKTNVNTTNGHILTSQTSCNLTPLIRPLVRNLEN